LKYQNDIAEIMSKYLGVVRNKAGLEIALKRLNNIAGKFTNFDNEYNKLKVKNAVEICRLVANAALIREESRGGHIRDDFQNENPEYQLHIVQQKGKNIHFVPIRKK
jgi:L-aspartate oxidase